MVFFLICALMGCSPNVSEEKAQELFDYAIKYAPCPEFIKFYVNEIGNEWNSDEERNTSARLMVDLFDRSYDLDPSLSLPRALSSIIAGTVLSKSDTPIDSNRANEAFDVAERSGVEIYDAQAVWSAWVTEVDTWCKPYLDEWP